MNSERTADQKIKEAISTANACDPHNFKHSEVRAIKRGVKAMAQRLEHYEAREARSTVEEF